MIGNRLVGGSVVGGFNKTQFFDVVILLRSSLVTGPKFKSISLLALELRQLLFMLRPELDPCPKLTPANSGIRCWPQNLNLVRVGSISTTHPKLTPLNTIYAP